MPSAQEQAFLQAIIEGPDDDTPRLVYADWLEEHDDPERAELIRVCEAMRRVPVFSDDYWRLKARRNELRVQCPADWLAATGYDGSRYDPIYRDGIPADWRGRWRLIREFAERWHGLAMGDVGGRLDEVRVEEERLGRELPPSLREYVAYAHDVAPPEGFGDVHGNVYTMRPLPDRPALSIMAITMDGFDWAVHDEDFRHPDPAIHAYYCEGGGHSSPFLTEGDRCGMLLTVSEFMLGSVESSSPDGGRFGILVPDPSRLRGRLEGSFPVRLDRRWGTTYEGGGVLAHLQSLYRQPGFYLRVHVHRAVPREQLPDFLQACVRHASLRGGMFLTAEDREQIRRGWGDHPPLQVLAEMSPERRGPASGESPGLRGEDDLPF